MSRLGQIVILNGAPRAGKSSIVAAIQDGFDGVWVNLGVDLSIAATPRRYRPGIGLRPGGERPDLEPILTTLYAALYESIAAHSRLGLNVVVDVGHHDSYAVPRGILADSARRLTGLPVLFVGIRCPLEAIVERRRRAAIEQPGRYSEPLDEETIAEPILRWQTEVHRPGQYDLEVDTSVLSSAECAAAIRARLDDPRRPPSAFHRFAAG